MFYCVFIIGASIVGIIYVCIYYIIINFIYCIFYRFANVLFKNSFFNFLEDNLISEICKR